jgi:hypothetical protein
VRRSKTKTITAFVGFVVFTIILSFCVPISRQPPYGNLPHVNGIYGDAWLYFRMAQTPTKFTLGHWGFRILTPWIVHILPVPFETGFYILTILGLSGTAWGIAEICRTMALMERTSIAAGFFFLVSFGSTFCLFDRGLTEPLAYFFTTLTFLFLARRKGVLAGCSIIVCMLDKEWALFLIPCFIAWQISERRILIRETAAGVIVPLAVFFFLRHWPGFGNGEYHDSLSAVWTDWKNNAIGNPLIPSAAAFGALIFIAPFGFLRSHGVVRISGLLILGTALQFADAGFWSYNQYRMAAYAFIPVIPWAMAAIDSLSKTSWWIAVFLIAICLCNPMFPIFVPMHNSMSAATIPIGAWLINWMYAKYQTVEYTNLHVWFADSLHVWLCLISAAIIVTLKISRNSRDRYRLGVRGAVCDYDELSKTLDRKNKARSAAEG